MRYFKRFSMTSWPAISLFLLLGTVIAGTAQAQLVSQITANGEICGGDLTTYGNCTAGEISVSQVTGTIYDSPWQGDQACVRGETVTALQTTVEYSIKTQSRYDLLLWLGEQEGTDPRAPAAGDPAKSCLVASLPGPFPGGTGNNVFVDLETDQCADINGTAAAVAESRVFTNLSVECQDNDNDGFADIQLLLTWSQNQNQSCGLDNGNGQSFPTNGANSKCDFQLLNSTLAIVEPASLTIVKNTTGGDDTFDFGTTGGLTGTAITTSGGTGSFTYTELRPIPDLTIFETLAPDSVWDATDITCTGATNNGTFTDSPTLPGITGIVISEGEDVVCTVSNTKLANLIVVKNTTGDNGIFSFIGNNGIGDFDLDSNDGPNTAFDTFTNLQPGTDYSLTETIPADWNLSSASCSSNTETADLATGAVTGITLAAGATVTCTFNNAKDGLSTITKISVGALGSFDFTSDTPAGNFSLTTVGAPSGGSSAPNGIALDAGQYTITEDDPGAGGWTLTDIQCTESVNVNSIIDIPNRQITLNVEAGEVIACEVTNTKDGTVIVEKQTIPADDPADFVFSGDLAGTLSDGEILTLSDNFGAAVTSDETVTDGWDLTDITCTGGTGASTIAIGGTDSFNPLDSDISVLPAPGETITCVYTNTKLAQLTIVKHITATGPLVQDFDFTSDIDGSLTFTLSPVDPGTDDQRVISGMDPGIYGVGENPPGADGWALTGASCGDGSPVTAIDLSPGEELTCTFTNSPLGSATVIKNTVGGDDTFAFVGDDPILGFNLDTTITTGTASADFTNVLEAGIYDVVETPLPAGWALTAVDCVDDLSDNSSGDLGTATATINVDLAETVTCTFENTADAQLVIEKVTIPATDTTEFTFVSEVIDQLWDGTGTANTLLATGESDSLTAQPDVQFVTETPVPGYVVTDIACSGAIASTVDYFPSGGTVFAAGDTSVGVVLAAGEVVTCAYTNTKEGSLTIVKDTVGDDGQFSFNHTVPNVASPFVIYTAVSDNYEISDTLLPGSYMASEVVPSGWDLTNIVCTGATDSTITIGGGPPGDGFQPGDNAVTVDMLSGEDIICTFVNTQRGSIEVVKSVTPVGPNTQAFTFNSGGGFFIGGGTSTTLDLTPASDVLDATSGTIEVLPGSTYTVSETVPAGWVLALAECDDGSDPLTGIDVGPGEAVKCTFTNSLPAITVAKNPATQAVSSGGTASFSIVVTNSGDVDLENVELTDALETSCNTSVGALAVGASTAPILCSTTNVTAAFINQADVTGDPVGGGTAVTANDTADVTLSAPAITVAKNPATQAVSSGGTASFSIVVTNSGDVDLENVELTDALEASCDTSVGALAAGASTAPILCETTNVLAAFTNQADVTGDPVGGGTAVTANDTAEVTLAILPPPVIEVIAVPVNDKLALLLLTLMLLVTGWYFRPAVTRKF